MECRFVDIKKNCVGSELIGIDIYIRGQRTFVSYEILRLLTEVKKTDMCFEDLISYLFDYLQKH